MGGKKKNTPSKSSSNTKPSASTSTATATSTSTSTSTSKPQTPQAKPKGTATITSTPTPTASTPKSQAQATPTKNATEPKTPTSALTATSSSSSTSTSTSTSKAATTSQPSSNAPQPSSSPTSSTGTGGGFSADQVIENFRELTAGPDMPAAVAAIQALTEVVRRSKAATIMGLEIELKAAADALKSCNRASISLAAGCELFNRYVTRTALDIPQYSLCVSALISRGEHFTRLSMTSRQHIAQLADRFIADGKVILIHGFSRVVQAVLLHAASQGKFFTVITTEGRPSQSGIQSAAPLTAAGIPVTMCLDSAVGYVMESVDLVLVGAEGVVESGGIINKIGTYTIALTAKALKRPFYVAAESYKFARLFPLNQNDLPETKAEQAPLVPAPSNHPTSDTLQSLNPACDYTPPAYITLLFTDLGILTPSAVSDELIKLYY